MNIPNWTTHILTTIATTMCLLLEYIGKVGHSFHDHGISLEFKETYYILSWLALLENKLSVGGGITIKYESTQLDYCHTFLPLCVYYLSIVKLGLAIPSIAMASLLHSKSNNLFEVGYKLQLSQKQIFLGMWQTQM